MATIRRGTFICIRHGNLTSAAMGAGALETSMCGRVPPRTQWQYPMAFAGAYHNVVCTRQGQVFTFRVGRYGQLGHGEYHEEFATG